MYEQVGIDMLSRMMVALPAGFLAQCKDTALQIKLRESKKVNFNYVCWLV